MERGSHSLRPYSQQWPIRTHPSLCLGLCEDEKETDSPRPFSQQWPMRTDLFSCLLVGLCTDGQFESRDSHLVFVPHQCPHGIVRNIKEPCKARPVAIKTRTLKNAVPLTTQGLSCGTRTRNLFVLLCWPLSMRPRRYDRFVLIGLCWLYGRSEFPPPPRPDQGKMCSYVNVLARLALQASCATHGGAAGLPA